MTSTPVQPVILCGGSGTRLRPLSRTGFPKQFLCLTGTESLFQQAAKRLGGSPYIVSNEEHRFLAQEQLREASITTATFLLEGAPPLGLVRQPAADSRPRSPTGWRKKPFVRRSELARDLLSPLPWGRRRGFGKHASRRQSRTGMQPSPWGAERG